MNRNPTFLNAEVTFHGCPIEGLQVQADESANYQKFSGLLKQHNFQNHWRYGRSYKTKKEL